MVSCNYTLVEPKEPIEEDTTIKYPDCPFYNKDFNFVNGRCDKIISVSYDGKYTSIDKYTLGSQLLTNRWILNNQSGEYLLIGGTLSAMDFDSTVLTQFRYIRLDGYFGFITYNSNKLVFSATTLVDTVGNRKEFIVRNNLFTYNISTKEIQPITPSSFGKGGAIYYNNKGINVRWLPESTDGKDILFLQYNKKNYKYHLQQDKLEEIQIEPFTTISNDLKLGILMNMSLTNTNKNFIINKNNYYLFDTLDYRMIHASAISFDNKYIVINVASTNFSDGKDTTQHQRQLELWIVEVDKWLASTGEFKDFRKINTRFQHCLYQKPGNPIAFTPQNTLLVSMHPHNNPQGNVYEMDLKGNIIRKITNN